MTVVTFRAFLAVIPAWLWLLVVGLALAFTLGSCWRWPVATSSRPGFRGVG